MTKKETPRLRLAIASVVVVLGVIYLLLLGAEFALAYLLRPTGVQLEKQALLRQRVETEDIPQRRAAIAEGWKPVISPGNVAGSGALRALAKELGVAPLAPNPNTRLYFCNEGYGLIRYTSDRLGFRNPDKVWDKDGVDMVLIGDSFAHGACVADDQTISAVLGERLNVINLGTIGNGPVHYAAIAKTFVPRLRPKTLVLLFYSNDFEAFAGFSVYHDLYFNGAVTYFDEAGEGLRPSPRLTEFYKAAQELAVARVAKQLDGADLLQRFSTTSRYWSGQRLELKFLRKQLGDQLSALMLAKGLPFGARLAVDTAIEACGAAGCRPVIAYIPSSVDWHDGTASDRYAGMLSAYAREQGIVFFDGTPALRALGPEAYARLGGHLSPGGYRVFAEELAKVLAP